MKKLIAPLFALSLTSIHSAFADCTVEQKAEMIKAGLSAAEVQRACENTEPFETTSSRNPKNDPNSTRADRGRFYIGFAALGGVGTETQDYTTNYYGSANSSNEIDYTFGGSRLKLGYITQASNRFELSYQRINAETDSGNQADFSGIDLDWLITIGYSKSLLPYFKLGLGSYTYQDFKVINRSGKVDELAGFAFNLGLGVIFEVIDDLEIEISYEGKGIAWQPMTDAYGEYNYSESLSLLTAGINYKF